MTADALPRRCTHMEDPSEKFCRDCIAVFVARAREEEREACAKIADRERIGAPGPVLPREALHDAACTAIAAAIRSRR